MVTVSVLGAHSTQVSTALKINYAFVSENSCSDWFFFFCPDRGSFSSILCIAIGGRKKKQGGENYFLLLNTVEVIYTYSLRSPCLL